MAQRFLGLEIGGTKLQIVVGDENSVILQRFRFVVESSKGADAIRQKIKETVLEVRATVHISAVGVGFGGPVDWKRGEICCSHQVQGWSGFPLANWLTDLAKVPVFIDNDANVASLAEAALGAGKGHNPVFYVTMGSGVGGGLVQSGSIYHGANPGEAEIGHIRLDKSGVILENRCSGWAVDAKVRAAIAQEPSGCLAKLAKLASGLTTGHAKVLKPALEAGDPVAQAIMDDTASDLAFGLSHVTHLFHPEIIVLGGGFSLVGEPLRQGVQAALGKWVMDAFKPEPKIALAKLGEDAVSAGALALAARSLNVEF